MTASSEESTIAASRRIARSIRLRSLMSRMALETSVPRSVASRLRLISTGDSPPSRRRPNSSSPDPIGRALGEAMNAERFATPRPSVTRPGLLGGPCHRGPVDLSPRRRTAFSPPWKPASSTV